MCIFCSHRFDYDANEQLSRITNKKQNIIDIERRVDGDELRLNRKPIATIRSTASGYLSKLMSVGESHELKFNYDDSTALLVQMIENGIFCATDFTYDKNGAFMYSTSPVGSIGLPIKNRQIQ